MRYLTIFVCVLCSLSVAAATTDNKAAADVVVEPGHAEATASLAADLESAESIATRLEDFLSGVQGEFSFIINFDYDKWEIRNEYLPLLNQIGAALGRLAPDSLLLVFEGHTDWDGSDNYNVWLSQQRAQSVSDYLARRHAVAFNSMELLYWGEGRPVEDNRTLAGMAKNRRVNFRIMPAAAFAQVPEPYAVAFSPSGRIGLSAMPSNKLVLHNADLDCRQRSLAGHTADVLAADFSPNGRLAISGARDYTVRLWDTATGRAVKVFYGHEGAVNTVLFGPHGRVAASGGNDRTLRLWDLVEDEPLAVLRGHEKAVTTISFSDNGWYLASGDEGGGLIIWDVGSRDPVVVVEAASAAITSVDFIRNDHLLVTDITGSARIWGRESGEPTLTLQTGGAAIYAAAVSPDSRYMVTADGAGQLQKWIVSTGARVGRIQAHAGAAVFADFSANGAQVMTAGADREHRIWDFDSGEQVRSFIPRSPLAPREVLTAVSHEAFDLWREPESGIELIGFPATCYQMGCGHWTDSCSQDELPAHEVCLDALWMGRFEISQEQWLSVFNANPSHHAMGGRFPVEQVSWDQAQEFICRLNEQTGLEFSLPTEAQWEFACRSGGLERSYAGGESQGLVLGEESPYAEVDEGEPNAAGLYGMSSGLWEWAADVYEDNLNVSVYSRRLRENPLHTGSIDYRFSTADFPRITRGGSWTLGGSRARCSLRHFDKAGMRNFFTGFRVALPELEGANSSVDQLQ